MATAKAKEIVGILMESRFYFELSLIERHKLVRQILYASRYLNYCAK